MAALLTAQTLSGQTPAATAAANSQNAGAGSSSSSVPAPPPQQKPPALVDPNGPAVSLETSEALFDVAVMLNACGYDDELATSDPIRVHVREQVNQALQQSTPARDTRDQICSFLTLHNLSGQGRSLARYVSLALFLTPPPDLEPSVDVTQMPPDSTQVIGVLPLLKNFVEQAQLHAIWLSNRAAYEEIVNGLHDPLTRMILETNIFLKMPTSTYDGRRFLVVLEPMLAPGQTNARVYGPDYLVVTSPANGKINMLDVRHTYLHYEVEPLLYARSGAIDRLLPVLKAVRDSQLDFTFKSDILALVTECFIRAIEARTLDTGIPEYKIPADVRRSDLDRVTHERNEYLQQVNTIRQRSVNQSMAQGFVLTQYFYEQLGQFEHGPASLKESIGEIVYGMDVEAEIRHAKQIDFVPVTSSDVVRHSAPRPLSGLDLAELKLMKGDLAGARTLAQQAIDQHNGDPGRAYFLLARLTLSGNNMEGAVEQFQRAIHASSDPRTLAWSHIYLGRIYDVQEERDQAVAEYKAALTVRDGQPDTRQAAEKGLKQPFELPHHAQPDDDDRSDAPPDAKATQPHP